MYVNPKARTLFWIVFLSAFCLIAHPSFAYVLNKEYDGHTVACSKLEEANEYVRIGKEESQEKAVEYFNQPDNSCFTAATKFKMEKIVSTHTRGRTTVSVVEGKVIGAYHPLFGYNAFEKPDTVYFLVGEPVTLTDAPLLRGTSI